MRLRLLALGLSLGLLLGAGLDDAVTAGQSAFERGDLADALVQWSVGLDLARKQGDADAELDLSLRLAAAHRELGRMKTARDLLDASEKLASSDVERGRWLTAQGRLDLALGDARSAERRFKDAFAAHQRGEDPRGAANAALNLGLARKALGKPEAEKALIAARDLFQTLGDDVGVGDALTNLGALYRNQTRLELARTTLEAAIEAFDRGNDAQGAADAMTNLALVFADLARPTDARRLYESALSTARARKDVRRQATLLLNLGSLDARGQRLEDAARRFEAAAEAFRTVGAERDALSAELALAGLAPSVAAYDRARETAVSLGDKRAEAIACLNLAALTDDGEARRYATRASELADELGLSGLRWRALTMSGMLEIARGKDKAGIAALEEAVAVLERARLGLDREEGDRFVTQHSAPYTALVDALLGAGRTAEAMAYAERLQRTEAGTASLDGSAGEKARAIDQELAHVEEALQAELSAASPSAERTVALRKRLAELHVAFADEVDRLRAAHPEFAQATQVDPEELQALQSDLPEGVLVLQPIALEDRLVLMVLSRKGLRAVTVDVPGADVDKQVGRLARSLRAEMTQDPAWTEEMCDKLGAWFLAPIAAELDDAKTVVVSASGNLRQLPFALLRHEGKYLVERAAVASVTHIGSLQAHATISERFQVEGRTLGLLGNPDGSLPGAEDEVTAIAKRFPGSEKIVGAASLERFEALARGKRTLHLATHGIVDPMTPTQSYLVMGPEERLSYRMIPGLAPDLGHVRMVVLSACESGLPVKARTADEQGLVISINGLAAQFRRAGVETLVASLWRVDDDGTRALMTAFYDELGAGRDVAASMRSAQLALLADPATAHPWYWAGFSVVGDWRR
ncbi:MAG: CHAT domain-containing protein [Deltaproteobacteria bacterium]|nr:MAG: CHAT domain-containing protein [Deltaproteobacteria bacterium]